MVNTVLKHDTNSGIAEAMESTVGIGWDMAILATVILVSLATLGIVWWSIDKLLRLDPTKTNKRSMIPAFIAFFGVGITGSLLYEDIVHGPDRHVDAVVAQNIAESFDLDDLHVTEAPGYHEEYTATVYGTAHGKAFTFEAVYNPDQDTMVPVLSRQDIDTLPIRDGSTLDALQRHDDMA